MTRSKNTTQTLIKPEIVHAAHNDQDSKLGTYLLVNPELKTPEYEHNKFELTKSHYHLHRHFHE